MTYTRPRYTDRQWLPYSYVPGHAPHPVSDPAGHMHGEVHEPVPALQTDAWNESETYLYGIDLFNHGYYWEAHEAWESLWHAAGRRGEMADFLKGLIKLAAAGVKAREGNPAGVSRHSARAMQLLEATAGLRYCGLQGSRLLELAANLQTDSNSFVSAQPHLLLDTVLETSTD